MSGESNAGFVERQQGLNDIAHVKALLIKKRQDVLMTA